MYDIAPKSMAYCLYVCKGVFWPCDVNMPPSWTIPEKNKETLLRNA